MCAFPLKVYARSRCIAAERDPPCREGHMGKGGTWG